MDIIISVCDIGRMRYIVCIYIYAYIDRGTIIRGDTNYLLNSFYLAYVILYACGNE